MQTLRKRIELGGGQIFGAFLQKSALFGQYQMLPKFSRLGPVECVHFVICRESMSLFMLRTQYNTGDPINTWDTKLFGVFIRKYKWYDKSILALQIMFYRVTSRYFNYTCIDFLYLKIYLKTTWVLEIVHYDFLWILEILEHHFWRPNLGQNQAWN